MSEHKPSNLADAMTTVYLIVLSVWMFLNGYALAWLIGMPLSIGAYLVIRRVFNSMEKDK